ncbi:histidine-specific methyltransferase [Xylaria digitata]|nr:histidine-specific methyltransferase [Xylaria digitata]
MHFPPPCLYLIYSIYFTGRHLVCFGTNRYSEIPLRLTQAYTTTMSPIKLELEEQPQLLDIRQGQSNFDPVAEITRGLTSQPLSIPSLLLWNDRGLKLFDRYTQIPSYYPFHSEIDVLRLYSASIGASMPAGGVLLELGCGAIHKTKLILAGLRKQQKPVHYFALDLSPESLVASVLELRRSFQDSPFITITGLLGTYDDCITWLSGTKSLREYHSMTVLWLGNSIANMDNPGEASVFLERFSTACERAQLACLFVVSIDICQKDAKVKEGYSGPEIRDWLLNSLETASLALGYDSFSSADWSDSTWMDNYNRTLHVCLAANRDVVIPLPSPVNGNESVTIRKGQHVTMIRSGKWKEETVGDMCEQAGFRIQQRWKDGDGDYCVFLLGQ